LQNLAWFYIGQRKHEQYAEAKQLLERSRTIRETLLGPEHPQVAMIFLKGQSQTRSQ
jgi:hypothetical protein